MADPQGTPQAEKGGDDDRQVRDVHHELKRSGGITVAKEAVQHVAE
jgi:hypothetical protein